MKKEDTLKEILIDIVMEMYRFGQFMPDKRAESLIKRIVKLKE